MFSAIGLMSGTSLDGVDVAWLRTDGGALIEAGPNDSFAYSEQDRAVLRAALAAAVHLEERDARPGIIAEAEALIDRRHIEAVRAFRAKYPQLAVDLVGYHGQTILHRPAQRLTVQIGRGQALADALGVDVMFDMRAAGVAAGGQGAPLVPVYHRALASNAGLRFPAALLNVGGVANITFLAGADAEPVACDTGPGNALIDDLMLERTGSPMDRNGTAAAKGRVDETILARLLGESFFQLPPPKSLDRNAFSKNAVDGLPLEDAAATLTAFTARAAAATLRKVVESMSQRQVDSKSQLESISELVVCGGGARNPTLIQFLRDALQCPVNAAEIYGWSSDAMEAQAFAYLAVRARLGLPLTFPGTTGCPAPMSGGVLARPS